MDYDNLRRSINRWAAIGTLIMTGAIFLYFQGYIF